MADAAHISTQDLATIGGKMKSDAQGSLTKPGFLKDAGLLIAQLAFVPLAIITLIPESRVELAGLGMDFTTSAVLWAALIVSGFFTMAVAKSEVTGKLSSFGAIVLTILFILALPITLGFVVMSLVSIAAGGAGIIAVLWKGIAFFAFVGIWFKGN